MFNAAVARLAINVQICREICILSANSCSVSIAESLCS